MSAQGNIERIVTSGTFELDGGSWEVDNNIWLVGDDNDVIVFDAAHDAGPIVMAVGGRNVVAVVCTHGHNDHVTVAPELGDALDAPVLLHPADDMLWRMTHADKEFRAVSDGDTLRVGGIELQAPGTATACPSATSRHRSACTPRAGCRWRSSSRSASGSTGSRTHSTRCTRARSCARW